MGGYVLALKLTSVANVMVIYATVPFVAAGIAFAWNGERTNRRALLASGVALAGIFVLVGGAAALKDLAGDGLAFLMTLAFAIQLVMARRYPKLEMSMINAAAAALCAISCWLLTPVGIPTSHQLLILALFGVTTTALAYLLFLTGGRYLPSGEAGLIGLLDVVLGPLWVWFFLAERPGAPALIGGGLVLASVCWYLSSQLRTAAPQ
jgi:drug/metabolite transporter (DMT)-like permease